MTGIVSSLKSCHEDIMTEYSAIRRWARYSVNLRLRLRIATPSGHEYMLGQARDVSQGGMAVYVPVELDVGDIAAMELFFPNSQEPITLSAVVKNRIGFKYGVEFVSPSPDQQQAILQNLKKLVASEK